MLLSVFEDFRRPPAPQIAIVGFDFVVANFANFRDVFFCEVNDSS